MRLSFIDIAKFGGIFLVILGHLPTTANIHTYIYSFHMPLFFILSGYLHKTYSNKDSLKKNIVTLIIPYVLLFTCLQLLEIQDIFRRGEANVNLIGSILATNYKAMILGEPRIYIRALWFLVALFEIKLVANILLKQKQSVVIAGCLCSLVLSFFTQHKDTYLYFFLDSAVIAFPFYICGFYLRKYDFLDNNIFSLKSNSHNLSQVLSKLALLIFLIVITYIMSYYNGDIDIKRCLFGKSFILMYILGILGSYMILLASTLFRSNKFITTISGGTIFILAFHGFIMGKVNLWIFDRNNIDFTININSIIIALLTLAISYPFIILTKKYFPILIGNRK